MTEKRKILPRVAPPVDSFYMGRLLVDSACCKDPEVQHAAWVVDAKDRPLGFGVNYIPKDYSNSTVSWHPEDRELSLVYAEEAAITQTLRKIPNYDFVGATMYVTGPPSLRAVRRCSEVALKTIIYWKMMPTYFDEKDWVKAKKLAKDRKIDLKSFDGNLNWVRDRIKKLEHLL